MRLQNSLECLAALPAPESLSEVRKQIDQRWIDEALQASGAATMRKRRLPAEQVVWLVIGMALFRNKAITEVVSSLDLALPTRDGGARAARRAPRSNPRARAPRRCR